MIKFVMGKRNRKKKNKKAQQFKKSKSIHIVSSNQNNKGKKNKKDKKHYYSRTASSEDIYKVAEDIFGGKYICVRDMADAEVRKV